jgi:hypothetical protein
MAQPFAQLDTYLSSIFAQPGILPTQLVKVGVALNDLRTAYSSVAASELSSIGISQDTANGVYIARAMSNGATK